MPRLQEKYIKEVLPVMREKFDYKNVMAVPKITKVVLNTGFGGMIKEKTADERKKIQEAVLNDLTLIAGQRAILTRAKKSIAGFKLRQGTPVGAIVVLRKKKMSDFLDRLIQIALPRTRDFQGIELKSIDKAGNLTTAVKEHIAFPEILPEKAKFIFSFEVTVVTTTKNREEGKELLRLLGFPIKDTPKA
ncbi:MAG: 50S ribosomal protein L5 [Candidatus Nealsonbacteria bacterium]|nr:50S ribosomal protein L5 [Candidatus Nealsonbacteria bacterium]